MSDLLKQRVFLPLFLTQFFGAFNDNAFKLAMLTLISYHLSSTQAESEHFQAIASALFTLPLFLFSAIAGELADKFDKTILTRGIKTAEIILMALGSIALIKGSIILMLITLTGMGMHSTFFGPIKYAILPCHLSRTHLLPATGLIEASTFIAILLGTVLGTLAIGNTRSHVLYAVILINSAAIIGFITSLFMPLSPPEPAQLPVNWHIGRSTAAILKIVLPNPKIFPVIFAISWFWLVGAVVLTKLPDYTHYVLRAETDIFAFFLGLFSIGIALGALTISRLLGGKITLQYVPAAMWGLSLFALDLYLATPSVAVSTNTPLLSFSTYFSSFANCRIAIDFFLFSMCTGLFIVPLYTYLQITGNNNQRARIIAANNILNALAMVIGSILVMLMIAYHFTIAAVFLVLAIANALIAWFLKQLLPQ